MLDDGSSLKPLALATALALAGLVAFVAWALRRRREPWARALPPASPPAAAGDPPPAEAQAPPSAEPEVSEPASRP